MLKKIGYYYPFTIPGSVSFGFIMFLIGAGYTQKNPYALFLSFVGLLILAVLITLTRIQAYRLGKEQLIWDASAALYSGRDGGMQRLYSGGFRSWFFFRIHVRIRGKLRVGKDASFRVLQESAFTGNGALELPLRFQCCGTFTGEAAYTLKDVFGLVRARAGDAVHRTIPVQPSLLGEDTPVRIDISGGEDDSQPRKSADQEKYYQREYMPGDRFRDINWKATSRIGEMFTRISPVTEEETKLVLIDFRHFSSETRANRSKVVHLEYLKRWCISFLWKIKNTQPEIRFVLYTGLGAVEVDSLGDIQRLSVGLSGLLYEKDPGVFKDLAGIGEIYIFTTPFDSWLGHAVYKYSGKRVNVFMTAAERGNGEQEEKVFVLPLLRNKGMVHIPGTWIVSGGTIKSPGVGGGQFAQTQYRYVKGNIL